MTYVELGAITRIESFDFRWPDGRESLEGGRSFDARIDGHRYAVRHRVGARDVYGRVRVHTVTWNNSEVQVDGAEADDYPASQALISRLRRPGRASARTWTDVPTGYGHTPVKPRSN